MNEVLYESKEGVVTLTLNLPHKLNPIAKELQLALRDALARIADDASVRAVVLTGAGKAFCVGADLTSITEREEGASADVSLGDRTAEWMQSLSNPLILSLRSLPVPVVCAVNGPAAGAGVGLALACDVVLAARSAYFYLPFLPKLGIVPDLGCSWMVPRLVGPARAMALALLDHKLDADRAAQWGLIWQSIDDDLLLLEAQQVAQKMARLPAHAVQEARAAFEHAGTHTLAEQLTYESERQRVLLGRPEFTEGVNAFLGKRAPAFKAR